MVIGGTKVVQVTNIAPQATKDQMQSLFGYLGKIEDIRLYPTLRDVSCPVQSRICYIKFADSTTTGVAQHMTNTVFIDRALIVLPISNGEIPDEYYALEMTKNGTIVPGLCLSNEPKLPPNVTNSISGIGQDQVILTFDPSMENRGLPAYPPLPANYDCGKIEEIRRTLLISNLDPATTADDIMRFYQPIGEIKYLRSCTRALDNTIHWLVEFSDQYCISDALSTTGALLNGAEIKVTHATQSIVKPQTKTNEAAQREIEEAMSRVKEAQSLISAAIDPVIGMLSKENKDRNSSGSHRRSRSRSRDRGRRRRGSRSRSRSRSRRSRSRHRSSRRRTRSRSRGRRASRSKERGNKRRSRSRKRSKSSRSPSSSSKSRGGNRKERERDKKRSKSREKRSKSREKRSKSREKRSKSRDKREKDAVKTRDKSKDRSKDKHKSSHSPANKKSKTPPLLIKDSSSKERRSRSPKERDRKEKKDSSAEKTTPRSRSHGRRSRSRDRGGRERGDSGRKDASRGRSKRSRTSSPRTVSRRRSSPGGGTPTRKDRGDKSRSRERERHGSGKRDEKRKDRSRSRSKVTPRDYDEGKGSGGDSGERKLSAELDIRPEEKESDNMDISNSP